MARALALVVALGLLSACAGKSTGGVDGAGGFIEAGGRPAEEAGAANNGGASNAGSAGTVTSGQACAPEGAQASNGCALCNCSKGQWACGHKVCAPKTCGGFAGNTCSDQEYCAYQPSEHCGAADASAACLARPDACDDVYSPVCGCDFNTYPNECDAALHGTGVLSLGTCPNPI